MAQLGQIVHEGANLHLSLASTPSAAASPEIALIFAAAYLHLLALHGPNWREHLQLQQERKSGESAESGAPCLDFPGNRSIRCTGQRGVTETPERG